MSWSDQEVICHVMAVEVAEMASLRPAAKGLRALRRSSKKSPESQYLTKIKNPPKGLKFIVEKKTKF